MCTECHTASPGLWSREGRDIAFYPFGSLAREKLILIQPAACTASLFLYLEISFGLPPFWVSQTILASTFSQTLHFTLGTPALFGLQSAFGLSLLSSLPPLFRLCAVSWLSRRRRRRSKLVSTCWCLARQNSFLSFPVTLGVGARSRGLVMVLMGLEALSCIQVTPLVCRPTFEHLHVKHPNQPGSTSVSPACNPSLFSCCSNLQ